MKFVCYSEWARLPASANMLFEQAAKDNVFFSRPWFQSLAATISSTDRSLLLACVVQDDRVLAMLPLMQADGNTGYSLKHGYTPLYSPLLADDDPQQVLDCLAAGLGQSPLKGLLLEPVASDDDRLNSLKNALEQHGFDCDYRFRSYNWVYHLHGQSFEEYFAERPARLRNTIARKQRKLQREHGYEIRLFTGKDVLGAMTDYYAVFGASWKQNESDHLHFMNDIVENYSNAGWSRLAILYVGERPVAAQLWFVHHGKASIFRLAYDKAWRQYSTGSILTSYLMQYVIDSDKVEQIDFLTGNEVYKQDWMSERRERFVLGCIKTAEPPSSYRRLLRFVKRMLGKI